MSFRVARLARLADVNLAETCVAIKKLERRVVVRIEVGKPLRGCSRVDLFLNRGRTARADCALVTKCGEPAGAARRRIPPSWEHLRPQQIVGLHVPGSNYKKLPTPPANWLPLCPTHSRFI